jgi:hypothetical protein
MPNDTDAAPDLHELLYRGTTDGNLRRERIHAAVLRRLSIYGNCDLDDATIDKATDEAIRIVLRVDKRIEELAAAHAPTTEPTT